MTQAAQTIGGAVAQRDADRSVLQRDYVPKKRAKKLVEALTAIASLRMTAERCWERAQEALAQLKGEEKPNV